MECTEEMLTAAVKKAVEVGLLPKIGFGDQVAENWGRVRAVIETALAVAPQNAGD